MQNDDKSKSVHESADGESPRQRGDRSRPSGSKTRNGQGGGPQMPFDIGAMMQMLPLLMAMGGGMPGMGMAGTQLRLIMMMIQIWIDYLAMMQSFLESVLDRLAEFGGRDDEPEADGDW